MKRGATVVTQSGFAHLGRFVAAVYSGALVVAAVVPTAEVPGVPLSDVLLHGLAYGVLGGLLVVAVCDRWRPGSRFAFAVAGATGWGVLTECLQLVVPLRSFDVRDIAADAIGGVIVSGLVAAVSLRAVQGAGESP